MKFLRQIILSAAVLLVVFDLSAETPLLERIISVSIQGERTDEALRKISKQAGFTFSYSSSLVESGKIVTLNATNKSVREVLDLLFNGTIQYKERGKYIILTRAEVGARKNDTQKVSGYVIDEATGERLMNVSVYDPVTLASAVTDAYGYFEMEVDDPKDNLKLVVNKANYADTLVAVTKDKAGLLHIPIKINTEKIATLADSVGQKIKRFWKRNMRSAQSVNMVNITDTLHRQWQFGLLPFVGSNHKLSGNVINDYSLNMLGGYSMGNRKFEMGGLFNMARSDVSGARFAGLFNITGGTVDAVQLAGLMNLNWNSTNTFGGAGLFNITRGDSRGTYLSGLGNITTGNQKGPHIAGLFNFATRDASVLQLGGLFNFSAANVKGAQVGGLFNIAAGDVRGAQVSGLLNITGKEVHGAQVAGLINYGTKVNGAQVGFLNISDTIKGVPVGFLSFVVKGYHKVEISSDEIFYLNLSLRTGVHRFYNILTAGAKPATFKGENTVWTFGYGVGTAPRLTDRLSLNIDLTSSHVNYGGFTDHLSLLNKVYIGVDYQAWKKMSLIAGITVNSYLTDINYTYPDIASDYKFHLIGNHTYSNDINAKMWLGARVGLRFF